jgi:hypothetical protein
MGVIGSERRELLKNVPDLVRREQLQSAGNWLQIGAWVSLQ